MTNRDVRPQTGRLRWNYRPVMIGVVSSCALGTTPCNDVGAATSTLVPWWGVVLIVLGAVALIAGFIGLLMRANRGRPWS